MDDQERYDKGVQHRRAVLGDAWVDRANSRLTDFNREFQNFLTRHAWGDVWNRPGLDRKTRSYITLSICIALGRWEEFRGHTRGAINNGITKEELQELIIHSAVYAGMPAANTAMHHAEEVIGELEQPPSGKP
ncbi:4-carboxymuconolactone decarboxylase [Povalibacter sp.]|uniref:4-carboxymuconolactone decarboxylase n=1 Tax=Povalibacter sp. TaxID=1962978 RepID=UPI002F400F76